MLPVTETTAELAESKTLVPLSVVREWATRRGIPVGSRGHLPEQVIAQFNRYHRTKRAESRNPSRAVPR